MVKIYGENQIIDSNGNLLPFNETSVNSIESIGITDNFSLKTFQRVFENYFELVRNNYKSFEKMVSTNLNGDKGFIKEYSSDPLFVDSDGYRTILPFVAYLNGNVVVNEPNYFLAARQLERKISFIGDPEFSAARVVITKVNSGFIAIITDEGDNVLYDNSSTPFERGYQLLLSIKTDLSLSFDVTDILLEPCFVLADNVEKFFVIDADGNIVAVDSVGVNDLEITPDNYLLSFNERIDIGKGNTYKATMGYDGTVMSFDLSGAGSEYFTFNKDTCFAGNVCSASACITGLVKSGSMETGTLYGTSCVRSPNGCFTNIVNTQGISSCTISVTNKLTSASMQNTGNICTLSLNSTTITNTGNLVSNNMSANTVCASTGEIVNVCSTNLRGLCLDIGTIKSTSTVDGVNSNFSGLSCFSRIDSGCSLSTRLEACCVTAGCITTCSLQACSMNISTMCMGNNLNVNGTVTLGNNLVVSNNSCIYPQSGSLKMNAGANGEIVTCCVQAVKVGTSDLNASNANVASMSITNLSFTGKGYLPINFVYTQYPGMEAPGDIFLGTWTEITNMFAGAFFRACGGGANAFGSGKQGEMIGPHNHTGNVNETQVTHGHPGSGAQGTGTAHQHYMFLNTNASGKPMAELTGYQYVGSHSSEGSDTEYRMRYQLGAVVPGGWVGVTAYGGESAHGHNLTITNATTQHGHSFITGNGSGTENRPANFTIKLWKRTA